MNLKLCLVHYIHGCFLRLIMYPALSYKHLQTLLRAKPKGPNFSELVSVKYHKKRLCRFLLAHSFIRILLGAFLNLNDLNILWIFEILDVLSNWALVNWRSFLYCRVFILNLHCFKLISLHMIILLFWYLDL